LLRTLWPDVVDHLRSAIRAGLPLPEALIQLGEKGPEELRHVFRDFGADYRAGGQFEASLNHLKHRLADPVADRIVEALRLTREVGGSDLGRLLGTLAEFLRENSRTRSELEARQSWTINAARLAVAAPWIVMILLATRPEAVQAYNTPMGAGVLLGGLVVSLVCYSIMLRIGALPQDERVLR
jgi:tight adherence protein B